MAEKTTAKEERHSEVREHMRAARREMRQSMESLFPPEFVEHRRQAGREMLLAFRGMIDGAIQRMDEK
jgi:hypothetical protein